MLHPLIEMYCRLLVYAVYLINVSCQNYKMDDPSDFFGERNVGRIKTDNDEAPNWNEDFEYPTMNEQSNIKDYQEFHKVEGPKSFNQEAYRERIGPKDIAPDKMEFQKMFYTIGTPVELAEAYYNRPNSKLSNKYRNWTNCDEFGRGALFHPKRVFNVEWVSFYMWTVDPHSGLASTFNFTVPSKIVGSLA